MKFTKKIVAVVAGVAMCAGLAACGGSRSGQATGGDAKIEKGATIGISMPTKSEERWNKDGNNLKAKLEKAGYKVILSFADDKPAQQNADIENMVNNDAKIVVVASGWHRSGPAVEGPRCRRQGHRLRSTDHEHRRRRLLRHLPAGAGRRARGHVAH